MMPFSSVLENNRWVPWCLTKIWNLSLSFGWFQQYLWWPTVGNMQWNLNLIFVLNQTYYILTLCNDSDVTDNKIVYYHVEMLSFILRREFHVAIFEPNWECWTGYQGFYSGYKWNLLIDEIHWTNDSKCLSHQCTTSLGSVELASQCVIAGYRNASLKTCKMSRFQWRHPRTTFFRFPLSSHCSHVSYTIVFNW